MLGALCSAGIIRMAVGRVVCTVVLTEDHRAKRHPRDGSSHYLLNDKKVFQYFIYHLAGLHGTCWLITSSPR